MKTTAKLILLSCLLTTSFQLSAPLAHAGDGDKCTRVFETAPSETINKKPVVATEKTETNPVDLENRKSPLAPKPLLVRLFTNLYRWYFKKDTRTFTEKKLNYLSDYEYIKEKRNLEKLGAVRSFFSKEFDTRIYYTATGAPNAHGEIPVVDPNSRGLFFYFHGSGTNKASGVNFAYKMNKMAALGYSTIAIDLPFHSEGSRSRKMTDPVQFYAMLHNLIHKYHHEGMPVYLAGHSFGPDVAAEYFKRYPHDEVLSGVLMISPGGFNKVLEDWFMNKTAHMTALWGDMVTNDDGAAWAGLLSSGHKWRNPGTPQSPDPTLVNPKVKVKVVTGEFEEYVPGELDARGLPTKTPRTYDMTQAIHDVLRGAEVTVEPGVGHYIFEHLDKNGHDVIIRSMLEMNNQSLFNEKELKATSNFGPMPEPVEVVRKYARDPFFKAWIDASQPGGQQSLLTMMAQGDLVNSRRVLNNYSRYVTMQRDNEVIGHIIDTKNWNSEFYTQHSAEIDAINPQKPRVSDSLLNKYFTMLEQLPEETRAKHATASPDTYKVPEKQGPPAHVLERMEKERLEKEKQALADKTPAAS